VHRLGIWRSMRQLCRLALLVTIGCPGETSETADSVCKAPCARNCGCLIQSGPGDAVYDGCIRGCMGMGDYSDHVCGEADLPSISAECEMLRRGHTDLICANTTAGDGGAGSAAGTGVAGVTGGSMSGAGSAGGAGTPGAGAAGTGSQPTCFPEGPAYCSVSLDNSLPGGCCSGLVCALSSHSDKSGGYCAVPTAIGPKCPADSGQSCVAGGSCCFGASVMNYYCTPSGVACGACVEPFSPCEPANATACCSGVCIPYNGSYVCDFGSVF
jgi:hypothetical protein